MQKNLLISSKKTPTQQNKANVKLNILIYNKTM